MTIFIILFLIGGFGAFFLKNNTNVFNISEKSNVEETTEFIPVENLLKENHIHNSSTSSYPQHSYLDNSYALADSFEEEKIKELEEIERQYQEDISFGRDDDDLTDFFEEKDDYLFDDDFSDKD